MKLRKCFLLGLILIFNYSVLSQESDWFTKIKGIVLMSSTRDDVIRIFGQPKDSTFPYYKSYELKEGKLDIEYSRGLCGDNKKEGWNVREFTVTRIFFDFAKPINPKKFPIDSAGFRKYPISDVPNAFTFENEEIGINYSMTSKGKIDGIEFYPSNDYDYLFCK